MLRAVRYRVLRKIAHGGMAEIFLAEQVGAEGFEKPVVLKRVLPALSADPAFVRMIIDEAHIASRLNHSHLVQVLDLGKADDQVFLVLEFVDGWSLEQVRRRARKVRLKLPLPLVLHIVSTLCRGLDYVHRRTRNGKPMGIVHRDVTPQNVLLSREGEVKLADFGIAKALGRREKSATGVIKGKFAYMSPEQTVGGDLDARSDLFSVGTLLYVLATGQKPFDAATDLDVLMLVRRARYEKPSTLVRDFNPDVERFIARALRPDRARRWQSAEQMADKLDGILVKLGQPSGPAVLKRWLETLSARDGILPPSELNEPVLPAVDGVPALPSGTISLVSGDLELQEVTKGEVEADDEWLELEEEPSVAPQASQDTVASTEPSSSVPPSQNAAAATRRVAYDAPTRVAPAREIAKADLFPVTATPTPTGSNTEEGLALEDTASAVTSPERRLSPRQVAAIHPGAIDDAAAPPPPQTVLSSDDGVEISAVPKAAGVDDQSTLSPAPVGAQTPTPTPRRRSRARTLGLISFLVLGTGAGAYIGLSYLPTDSYLGRAIPNAPTPLWLTASIVTTRRYVVRSLDFVRQLVLPVPDHSAPNN